MRRLLVLSYRLFLTPAEGAVVCLMPSPFSKVTDLTDAKVIVFKNQTTVGSHGTTPRPSYSGD